MLHLETLTREELVTLVQDVIREKEALQKQILHLQQLLCRLSSKIKNGKE